MSEWIKCSDRLPDDGGHYLGINSAGHMATFTRIERKYLPPDCAPISTFYAWMDTPEKSICMMGCVTHWMPLPPPPQD